MVFCILLLVIFFVILLLLSISVIIVYSFMWRCFVAKLTRPFIHWQTNIIKIQRDCHLSISCFYQSNGGCYLLFCFCFCLYFLSRSFVDYKIWLCNSDVRNTWEIYKKHISNTENYRGVALWRSWEKCVTKSELITCSIIFSLTYISLRFE